MPLLPDVGAGRAAQPPGGRSSFVFDDGSQSGGFRSRFSNQAQPFSNAPTALSRAPMQPPGGRSSLVFDDRNLMVAADRAVDRRHTSGLKRVFGLDGPEANRVAPMASAYNQPPGGRSTFTFSDPALAPESPLKQRPVVEQKRNNREQQNDALDDFIGDVKIAERRTSLAPPGGHSSFSIGWGGDASVNHHHAYSRGKAGGASLYPSADLFSQARQIARPSTFHAAPFAAATAPSSVHTSVQVAMPPGGRSQIVFG